jgi:DNA-binding MarR family transcriptional regulator
MHQQALNFEAAPLARGLDPESSHRAAEGVVRRGTVSKHERQILDGLRDHPNVTAAELAKYIELDHVQIGKRTGAMAKKGLIEIRPARRCTVRRRMMHTLRALGV